MPAVPGRLIFTINGTEVRSVALTDRPTVIGRAEDADISFPRSLPLSRRHCEVEMREGRPWIKMLGCRGNI
jgi:predicted component of type VI protein secretion system